MLISTNCLIFCFHALKLGDPLAFACLRVYHQAMKTIAVFFDAPGFDAYPFDDPDFRQGYHDFAKIIAEMGGVFRTVREMSTYQGGTTFSGGWEFEDGAFVRKDTPLTSDVIWNKGHFQGDPGIAVVNDPELEQICNDKWMTYTLFREYCPETAIARGASELNELLTRHDGNMVVCKPLDGERGFGVVIGKASQLPRANISLPTLVQGFIDTSGGIPGIVEGMHDFRIISLAGTIGASYVRTPPDGMYAANVSQGGKEITVPRDRIPSEAMAIFTDIDGRLSRFPKRSYSIDMGRDRDGNWKLIELNAKPGLPAPSAGDEYWFFLKTLAELLMS
jgi:glutathione synthase/RimK-type ligase-like ATP-grasp enzyme